MKKILLTIAAALTILTASIASPASAAPKGNAGNHVIQSSKVISNAKVQPTKAVQPVKLTPTKLNAKVNPSNLTKATKFSQGYFYKGKDLLPLDEPTVGCSIRLPVLL